MQSQTEYRGRFVTPASTCAAGLSAMLMSLALTVPSKSPPISTALLVMIPLVWLGYCIRATLSRRLVLNSQQMTYSNNGLAPVTISWKNVKAVHTFTSDEGEVGALGSIVLELKGFEGFIATLLPAQRRLLTPANFAGNGVLIYVFGFNVPRDRLAQEMCQRAGLPGPIVK